MPRWRETSEYRTSVVRMVLLSSCLHKLIAFSFLKLFRDSEGED